MSKKSTKPNIKSLPLQKFLSLTPNRLAKIKDAPETPVRQLEEYNANAMAMALHPAKQFLVISQIIDHKNGFKSFVFEPDLEKGTKNLAFASAGQYINFKFSIGTSLVSRPYSFSSSPKQSEEGKYMISIKKMPEGFSSNYIFDNWTVGTKVEASAPLDLMTYEPLRDAPVVIAVAGGSGITPFYSMAQAIKDGYEDFDLILLYGTRTIEDGIFLEEMKAIEKACPRFKMINILSDEKIETAKENEICKKLDLTLEEGFITADIIKKYAPQTSEYSVFMCGPGAMYKAVDKECEILGIKKRLIRHGATDEYKNPQNDKAFPKEKAGNYTLTIKTHGSEHVIPCCSEETLLVAMERSGIAAPSQCRRGTCGWCRSKLVSGDVYIPATVEKRRMADRIYGYIHPCCTFPIDNIVIYLE